MGQSSSQSSLQFFLPQLADVEWQLIMHGLEGHELIRLARCNRQLLHASQSPFAWQHTALIIRNLPKRFPSSPSKLLQYAQVHIVPNSLGGLSKTSSIPALLHFAATFQPQHLDCSMLMHKRPIMLQWQTIMDSPHMQQLRFIAFPRLLDKSDGDQLDASAPLLRSLAALPSLHTLSFGCMHVGSWHLLKPNVMITSLQVGSMDTSLTLPQRLVILESIKQLTDLTFTNAVFTARGLCDFMCHPLMARIQTLTLDRQSDHHIMNLDASGLFITGFAALASLHTLHLDGCQRPAMLIQFAISHAPSLRLLIISPLLRPDVEHVSTYPSSPLRNDDILNRNFATTKSIITALAESMTSNCKIKCEMRITIVHAKSNLYEKTYDRVVREQIASAIKEKLPGDRFKLKLVH